GEPAPVPFRDEIGPVRRLRAAQEELARDLVALVGPPLEVRTEDVVVAAAVLLVDDAARVEEPHERRPEVLPHAADAHERAVVLEGEARLRGAGDDDAPAAPVLRGE